ncbi:MAG TPA: glycoside hydrolase family 88 protein [Lacunisphaera sp.]|jgi:rhamnogalacturonyl hydrolase YesR|nr:glycoside hydrolase family 88 protein [Lacunisphaera sp.]
MKATALSRLLAAALLAPAALLAQASPPAVAMRRVFDWQVAHPWSATHPVNGREGTRGWVQGAFLTGVMEAWRATKDDAYLKYAEATATANSWQLGPRERHADDHIVGQTYLELYELAPAPEKIASVQATLDKIVATPQPGHEFWSWCDALYMSPPTFAKLAHATHEPRYLEAMDRFYWDSYLAFYDPAERLFYRDQRFVFPKEGPKIFWSRGNGWVIAGLARLLDALPAEFPTRGRYVALYQAMAARLAGLQPADGLWHPNLLQPAGPHGEASGSAFFCYALAWGINRGLLPAAEYRPVVDKVWAALLASIDGDGRLGWVQPIGFAPDAYDATTWQEYGSGAFLAAGAQVMQLR